MVFEELRQRLIRETDNLDDYEDVRHE